MDSQVVELLGRNRLTDELLRAGFEVARPVRDRGIDLIAYADLTAKVPAFIARPIQMKAATDAVFGLDQKYAKFRDLIIAYVWHLGRTDAAVTYALSYVDAHKVAEQMGYTRTASWARGNYVTNAARRQGAGASRTLPDDTREVVDTRNSRPRGVRSYATRWRS